MKNIRLDRRSLLASTAALAAPLLVPGLTRAQTAAPAERRFEPQVGGWRTFEVTTTVQIADVQGATQLWLPVPDIESDYQRSVDNSWTGNARTIGLTRDPKHGVRMLHAAFAPETTQPTVTLTSTLRTRNRAVDWNGRGTVAEDPAVLKANLQPTELKPLDGIVRKTALEATRGAKTDLDKVRALYGWVVAHAYREPKTRGCGTGDIKTMLETGNLGGKCADLNAVFVGLCRAVGVPARDVYGLRLVPSAFGYKELSGNPANLKGAQHCRAEVHLAGLGWVAMDPADVLKVMRQETPDWIKDPAHPVVAPVMKGLFGGWEGNWVGWNTVNDLVLPGSADTGTKSFLMYPNGENASGRFDELAPDTFKYVISARELTT
ncbi:transglutaminase-like domain-containing protein [Leptothrix discophora]|uniref:Transglutaminase domain-containing protein n=1 Tax=Leptothrix discophora TaxID=89 RepID=A0ABT9G531_LEPDI|nr:transglutaminase domain-containing protein [Leptothrix discophora]MDP4301603.1 transglutaminase domain-containing protein [Leptothrix discophora]